MIVCPAIAMCSFVPQQQVIRPFADAADPDPRQDDDARTTVRKEYRARRHIAGSQARELVAGRIDLAGEFLPLVELT